jgi:SWI/SNF-related matrix-associated actin-dependent regulator 1 of chromatin subfamily A
MDQKIEQRNGLFEIWFDYDWALKERVKALPGRAFVGEDRDPRGAHWTVSANSATVDLMTTFAAANGFKLELNGLKEKVEERVLDSGSLVGSPIPVPGLNPQTVPHPYQWAGVAYALDTLLRSMGIIIADEMGLGKSLMALMILACRNAFPAIVVGLAAGKYGWKREIGERLPEKRVLLLEGLKALDPAEYQSADIILMNYDLLRVTRNPNSQSNFDKYLPKEGSHLEALIELGLPGPNGGIVYDEAHAAKDYKSQRSRGAKMLARRVKTRLALTGTPVLNKSDELVSIVTLMGQMDQLGGFYPFLERYTSYGGGSQHAGNWSKKSNETAEDVRRELHKRLREVGYLRRTRNQVFGDRKLLERQTIWLEIDNRKQYDKAETDLSLWLESQGRKAMTSEQAETLAKIGVLRQLAAKGKIKQVIEWITEFLKSDKKLVVFAHHIAVQDALAAEFPGCAQIKGGQKSVDRDAQVQKFRYDADCRLMVASIQAGGTGVDGLQFACSDVAFVELAWNPGQMDQAEGRLDRQGQKEPVARYYFLAKDTVDEEMLVIVDEKRKITAGITDGATVAELLEGGDLLGELEKTHISDAKALLQKMYARNSRVRAVFGD